MGGARRSRHADKGASHEGIRESIDRIIPGADFVRRIDLATAIVHPLRKTLRAPRQRNGYTTVVLPALCWAFADSAAGWGMPSARTIVVAGEDASLSEAIGSLFKGGGLGRSYPYLAGSAAGVERSGLGERFFPGVQFPRRSGFALGGKSWDGDGKAPVVLIPAL